MRLQVIDHRNRIMIPVQRPFCGFGSIHSCIFPDDFVTTTIDNIQSVRISTCELISFSTKVSSSFLILSLSATSTFRVASLNDLTVSSIFFRSSVSKQQYYQYLIFSVLIYFRNIVIGNILIVYSNQFLSAESLQILESAA